MKKTLILLFALVGVILVINIANKLSAVQKNPPLFKGLDKAAVTQVLITKGQAKETLKKESTGWMATEQGDYPADTAKINELLGALAKQEKGRPRSKNPEKHKELKVDSTGATRVVVEAGSPVTFYIGGMAQGYQGNYVRLEGDDNVYVSEGNLERLFSTDANFYRDKTLFKINKDDVNEFSVTYKDIKDKDTARVTIAARFDPAAGTWKIEKPEAADGDISAINEYIGKFTGLTVDDWYDKDTAAVPGFDDPLLGVVFKKGDGTAVSLLVGNEKDGNCYTKVVNDDNKYLLRRHKIDGLKKTWTELKAKEKAAGDTAKTDLNATQPGALGQPKLN
jgi:hypothetical protein